MTNISAKSIVFTRVGIPKDIQSDQESNFTNKLFSEVLKDLGIKQQLSSAYHPQSQGVLERWHETLKVMLRKYCLENEHDWDESVLCLLSQSEKLSMQAWALLLSRFYTASR